MEFLSLLGFYIGSCIFLPYKINDWLYIRLVISASSLQFKIYLFCVLNYSSSKQGGKRTDVVSTEAEEEDRLETGIMDVSLEIMKNAFSTIVALFHILWPFGRRGHGWKLDKIAFLKWHTTFNVNVFPGVFFYMRLFNHDFLRVVFVTKYSRWTVLLLWICTNHWRFNITVEK